MKQRICARQGCCNPVGPRHRKYCCGDCAYRHHKDRANERARARNRRARAVATSEYVRHLERELAKTRRQA